MTSLHPRLALRPAGTFRSPPSPTIFAAHVSSPTCDPLLCVGILCWGELLHVLSSGVRPTPAARASFSGRQYGCRRLLRETENQGREGGTMLMRVGSFWTDVAYVENGWDQTTSQSLFPKLLIPEENEGGRKSPVLAYSLRQRPLSFLLPRIHLRQPPAKPSSSFYHSSLFLN